MSCAWTGALPAGCGTLSSFRDTADWRLIVVKLRLECRAVAASAREGRAPGHAADSGRSGVRPSGRAGQPAARRCAALSRSCLLPQVHELPPKTALDAEVAAGDLVIDG